MPPDWHWHQVNTKNYFAAVGWVTNICFPTDYSGFELRKLHVRVSLVGKVCLALKKKKKARSNMGQIYWKNERLIRALGYMTIFFPPWRIFLYQHKGTVPQPNLPQLDKDMRKNCRLLKKPKLLLLNNLTYRNTYQSFFASRNQISTVHCWIHKPETHLGEVCQGLHLDRSLWQEPWEHCWVQCARRGMEGSLIHYGWAAIEFNTK